MDGQATQLASIGRFSLDDVPAVPGFAAFRRAVLDPDAPDCQLRHAPDRLVDVVPQGLTEGHTVFGEGRPIIGAIRNDPVQRLQRVAGVALNDAVLAPDSMAVLSATNRFFEPSIANLAAWDGRLSIADPHFIEVGAGWQFADPALPLDRIDAIALPAGGVGSHNYGHFLYDGLPAALQHRLLLGKRAVLAGRALLPWQAEILGALGLLDGYIAIDRPTRFRKIVTSDMVSFTVSYPNRFIRAVFDRLRFRFGAEPAAGRRLLISRATPDNLRILENRTEIEAIAARHGFEVVYPGAMGVAAQVRLFAGADCVVGESGAALANLGFCDPGTRVLEIQADCSSDGWTRAACHLLGLQWHGFFAVAAVQPGIAARAFRFRVDPKQFDAALAAVFSRK